MSWHYSQEQGEGFSVENYLAGVRLERLKSRIILDKCCLPDNETDSCPSSPSGTMCVPLTAGRGEDSLTLSAVGSHAKTSALPEKGLALRERVQDSGRRCTESFARYDRDSRSWKTPQGLLAGDSEPYSGTWPKLGMMRHGWCSERTMSALLTNGTAFGFSLRIGAKEHYYLMPTPTVCQAPNSTSHTKGPKNLLQVAQLGWNPGEEWPVRRELFPTPCAHGAGGSNAAKKWKKLLPTPLAHNAKELTPSPSNINRRTPGLGTLAAWGKLGEAGRLSPMWVEWLMGWPIGWTDLQRLETAKYHLWLQQHSLY